MKNALALLALLALAGQAAAQAPGGGGGAQGGGTGGHKSGGSGWSNPGGSKNGMGGGSGAKEKPTPVNASFRCHKDPDAAVLTEKLQKITGVGEVEVDAEHRVLRVQLIGGIGLVNAVADTASGNGCPVSLLSPARFSVWFEARSKDIDIEALKEGVKKTIGVTQVTFGSPQALEAVADFQFFDYEKFRDMAEKAGFSVSIKGYESITLALSGPMSPELEKKLQQTKGVLRFKAEGDTVLIWAADGVGETVLKDAAKAAALEIRSITRKG